MTGPLPQADADADALAGGFADPPVQAAVAFRAVLDALARPGRIVALAGALPPAPASVAAGVLLLTLADGTTPVWIAPSHAGGRLARWLAFHCGARPVAAPDEAAFALGTWETLAPVLQRLPQGTPDYPDRSATLIVEVPALAAGTGTRLTGPGIRGAAHLPLPDPAAFAANHARFPLGFDTFLTCGDRLAGLPRSSRPEIR